ncbi:putative amidase AmiB2 [Catellatospora sp. TT07R-123]|uniref:amidase n=1 Tax=Catellatospora sp. TT07R-123 TaxID=2733863 RepID=UPI001B1B4F1A|nr:amidase [Catellatospora sp. TT07R-123]GHJ45955.1 putative amidase AmiB2 [Catellatospora sp. TT07R-123]
MADTWVGSTAKQIARAVRRGDTSATAVVADHLEYVSRTDPIVAAFRVVRGAEAAAEAEKVDEQGELGNLPLAGVPIAVKENTPVAGVPTWHGSAAARTPVAEQDHELVRRLRGAGAIVLGTTRMPELGLWGTTDDDTAVTRNPWALDRTPGGSSGGSAAAVAAGLVPMAHANDGLGSIRIPAACCGLIGLKPGRGVLPVDLGADDWFGLVEHGMLATTVADAALGFAVLAGRTPQPLNQPGRLRIAVSLRSPVAGSGADAANRAVVQTAEKLLADCGHDLIGADPAYSTRLGLRGMATWFAAAYRDAEAAELERWRLQRRTRRHIAMGAWAWRRGYVQEADRKQLRDQALDFFAEHSVDLLLTPVLAGAPMKAATWHRRSWLANVVANTRYAPYAAPWNIAGFPAMTLPMGVRPDGLPAAVQLVGPPGTELLLLAVAGQIELASPWRRHAPGYPRP